MSTPLSPGLAQAGLALLELLQRRPLTAPDLLSGMKTVGGRPPSEALALSQVLNWLAVDEAGVLFATPAGLRVIASGRYEFVLRRITLDYAELLKPDWLQNAPYGRSRVLAFCPPGVGQILVESGAADAPTDDVVAFWDELASIARGLLDDRLLAIGRQGERLTLAHEQVRTGASPRWVAIDSNQDGYDVLSIKAADDPSLLSIEVKASRAGLAGHLHITRREWDTATESAAYVFHLWDLKDAAAPRLAAVPLETMADHMPSDTGGGFWESVRVPFHEFTELFGDHLA
ncbi:DUF3883 domain-containing protein [Mesorhizobium sp. 1M-11]|uniref:DUF3883 domain-containing protein n=1 Tax=Mesorhizobium sp. 1M-11 TaxID=1529006 RepID=UPI0006C771F7|nr:DUF3883 domain-containing protein [Mesorhizobium sp. 1M-11]